MHKLYIRVFITGDLEISDGGLFIGNSRATRKFWAGPFLSSPLNAVVLGDCQHCKEDNMPAFRAYIVTASVASRK